MSTARSRLAGYLTLTVFSLLLVACSAGPGAGSAAPSPAATAAPPSASPPAPAGIDHPTGPDQLVLRIDTDGGFVAPGFILTHIPEFSLYGDGRIVMPGPQIAIYPAPALPSLVEMQVSEAGIQRILEAASAAGLLGPDLHYQAIGIADAGTTTFTLVSGGARHTVSAYALGIDASVPQAGPDAAARKQLAALRDRLTGAADWLADTVVEPQAQYALRAVRIYSDPAQPGQDPSGIQPTHADWPLATPLAAGSPAGGGPDTKCTLVDGEGLAVLLPALRSADQLTIWRSGGSEYQLRLRPLLPDESGCRRVGG